MIKFIIHPKFIDFSMTSTGWFRGFYFIFKATYSKATISFARTQQQYLKGNLIKEYELAKSKWPFKGYYPKWRCYFLIFLGCIKFFFNLK